VRSKFPLNPISTNRKKAFVVNSERPLSSVFEPTLTQEMLNQTSVKQSTLRSSPPRRLRTDNWRGDFAGNWKQKKHQVGLVPKSTWCRDTPHRQFVPHNRRCVSLQHVSFGTKPTWCFFCLNFKMHHHAGFDHNRRGDLITMTVLTITDVVFVFF